MVVFCAVSKPSDAIKDAAGNARGDDIGVALPLGSCATADRGVSIERGVCGRLGIGGNAVPIGVALLLPTLSISNFWS
jgi:hypothetical protein